MPRLPRFVIPDVPQHVILRGNNRAIIFAAPEDYQFFLEKLKSAFDKHGCVLHAYGSIESDPIDPRLSAGLGGFIERFKIATLPPKI
jgi:hypothetical protein